MGLQFKRFVPSFLVLAVLLVGTLLTMLSVRALNTSVEQRQHLLFDREVERLKASLHNQLNQQALLLTAVRGVFAASQQVTPDEFELFAGSLDLKARFPAASALAYARRVPARDLDAYIARRNEDTPGFKFRYMDPNHQRGDGDRYVVELVQPVASRPALGLESSSNTDRWAAIERAGR